MLFVLLDFGAIANDLLAPAPCLDWYLKTLAANDEVDRIGPGGTPNPARSCPLAPPTPEGVTTIESGPRASKYLLTLSIFLLLTPYYVTQQLWL
jgi:hypothetical protein